MEMRVDLASVGLLFAPRNDADAYDTDEGEYGSSGCGGLYPALSMYTKQQKTHEYLFLTALEPGQAFRKLSVNQKICHRMPTFESGLTYATHNQNLINNLYSLVTRSASCTKPRHANQFFTTTAR